jgi:hypothetical protein
MPPLIGVVEKPCEGFDIEWPLSEGKPESKIVSVEKIGASVTCALIIGIVVAVMPQDESQIFYWVILEGEMPIKLCPFVSVIVCDKLGEKRGVFGNKNKVAKSKIPPVLFSRKIVIAREGAGMLEMSEKLPMDTELSSREKRGFFLARPKNKDLIPSD